jgi:hypothetical protein
MAALPPARRARIEARARELLAEESVRIETLPDRREETTNSNDTSENEISSPTASDPKTIDGFG